MVGSAVLVALAYESAGCCWSTAPDCGDVGPLVSCGVGRELEGMESVMSGYGLEFLEMTEARDPRSKTERDREWATEVEGGGADGRTVSLARWQ